MAKKWTDMSPEEQNKLRRKYIFWRAINWALVSFLVIRAVCALTWLLPADAQGAVRLIAAIAIIAYSLVNVFVWSNQTDMDMCRMSSGVRITLVATVAIVVCRVLRYIGVALGILMVAANFWPVMIVYPLIAGALCFSITKEKQMTDKVLSKDRTPPKREHFEGEVGGSTIKVERWTG